MSDLKEEKEAVEEQAPAEEKKLSKGQKKKAKAKAKGEDQKEDENQEAGAQPEAEKQEAAKGGKKGKKPAMNAAAKLAQERLKLKQEEEERQRLIEEEEKRKEEEEELKRKEEEDKRKAEEEAKRAVKREKKNKLISEGKWLSKKEKQKKDEAEKLRAALIENGIIKVGEEEEKQEKKSKVIKNKRGKKKQTEEQEAQEQKEEKEETKEEIQEDEEKKPEQKIAAPAKEQEIQIVTSSKEEHQKEPQEAVVDDWDDEDIDEMANKIVEKDVETIKGVNIKPLKKNEVEDEDEEEKMETPKESGKNPKLANERKKSYQEEAKASSGGSSLFDRAPNTKSIEEKKKELAKKRALAEAAKKAKPKKGNFRCPIICVLGHVDTGKTLILDKLRKTNVQAGEAGGITQQIGATYFPEETLLEHLSKVEGKIDLDLEIPGFLVIDTPGHESFTNLRSRGSNLCDMAILVVDLMHGLENQTLESMQLLKQKKTPFVVALNKIDRNYGWKPTPYNNVRDSLAIQDQSTQIEFQGRLEKTIVAFAEQEINSALYWENQDPEDYVSLCPTSAITGEGLPDLMIYIAKMCQERFYKNLQVEEDFECTVLEVKVIEGLGTTIDVILVNGTLKVGDTIILSGFNGHIQTNVRALLTPQPLKEMRVKGEYIHHEMIKGAMGIKICAPNLEQALAGSELLKANTEDEIKDAIDRIQGDLSDIVEKYVDKTKQGVCVQASTLGSLEALLEFLKNQKIPVCAINIGPVHKKDILKAMKSLTGEGHLKEFASILAFDVKITPEAQEFADENGIRIFTAEIIYRLFDEFCEYLKKCVDERKNDEGSKAVFPCILEIVKDGVFNGRKPIIIGVNVKAGILKVGTPLCIPDKGNLRIGQVTSIELSKKSVQTARAANGSVAIKIEGENQIMVGRHFDHANQIASYMTRDSIDALKHFFKDDLNKDDWKLVIQLKKMFQIP